MKYTWLFFVVGAVLSWGAYVVTIDHGRTKLAEGLPRTHMAVAAMRAFLFIGLAYFVLAVVVPGFYLMMHKPPTGQDPGYKLPGSVLSTVAGILGAAGALCIVFAVGAGRRQGVSPAVVGVPGFAVGPIGNVCFCMILAPPAQAPQMLFWVGAVSQRRG